MKIACEKNLTLTETKNIIKAVKKQGGKIVRGSYSQDTASLVDNRKRSHTLIFKSNLQLQGLF